MQQIFFTTYLAMENTNIREIHFTDSIHYELAKTAKLMKMLTMQLFDRLKIEISLDECSALDMIACNDGICQRDLAKLILKDRANTGRILDSLEEKGFIKRFVDTKNNRLVKKMGMTQKGLKTLREISDKIISYLENVTGVVPHEEMLKVRNVLRDFRLNLENKVEMKI